MSAQELFESIGVGKENAVRVNSNNSRKFRMLVADANNNGDCIINTGGGYYRPDPNNEVERDEFNHYMASELARARAIQYKRLKMKEAFEKV